MKQFKRIFIIFFLALTVCLFGCKKDEPVEVDPPVKEVYTITYNLNGGTFSGDVARTFEEGSSYVLPTPTRDKFEFIGWKEIKDGNVVDEVVTELENRNYELKATWKRILKVDVLSDEFTTTKKTKKDVVYKVCSESELKMDIYLPAMEEGKKYPVLFFFYGGGWIIGDKSYISLYSNVLKDLNGEGFIVVAPNYRLSTTEDGKYPHPVEDCFDAIRYVVKYQNELHADVNNMGSFGHSAGGYFALMAGYAQNHYKGDDSLKDYEFKLSYVISLSAPSTYDEESISLLSLKGKTMLMAFLGTSNFTDKNNEKKFPSYYVNENQIEVYIVHGGADELVPISQSTKFSELAAASGSTVHYIEVPHAMHMYTSEEGYDISIDYAEKSKILRDFILSHK